MRYPQSYHNLRLDLARATIEVDNCVGKQGQHWKLAARLANLDAHLPALMEEAWYLIEARVLDGSVDQKGGWANEHRVDTVFTESVSLLIDALVGVVSGVFLGLSVSRRQEIAGEVVAEFVLFARRGGFAQPPLKGRQRGGVRS